MKANWRRIILGIMLFGALGAFFVPASFAVQVKKVQTGTVTLDLDDTLALVDLATPVADQSKSVILLSARSQTSTANSDQAYLFTAIFEDSGTLLIERAGTANLYARVTWTVIEFADGVNVQRGFSSMKDTTAL